MSFIVGEAWRKKATGDDSSIDWSVCDDWVCPIHYRFDDFGGKKFVVDAVVDSLCCSPDDPAAPAMAKMKARVICQSLNVMAENQNWLDFNIGFLTGA